MSAAEQLDDTPVQRIVPHPRQLDFLGCEADIAFYGGAAGGGKSWALVLDQARWAHVRGFRGIIFRRVEKDLENLWEKSAEICPLFHGVGRRSGKPSSRWRFPSGAKIYLSHLQLDRHIDGHMGQEYAVISFDEVTQFTEKQFWALYGRNRSTCGVLPYVRASCNPQSEGWVRDMVDWYIDERGYPIADRAGKLRYFVRTSDDKLDWGNTREEVEARNPGKRARSFTFIPAKLSDNPTLESANGGDYGATLDAMPRAEMLRLKDGNWNVRDAAGDYYREAWFPLVDAPPMPVIRRVRFWDLAATKPSDTNKDPDWTKGLRASQLRAADGGVDLYLDDLVELRDGPGAVLELIRRTARADGYDVEQGFWQDPGQAGKAQIHGLAGALAGYMVQTVRANQDKRAYAKVASPIAKAGRIHVKAGQWWTKPLLRALEAFPYAVHDDDADALSGLVQVITKSAPLRSFKVRNA